MSSPVWSVTIGIRANSEWWPGEASRDPRGRDQQGLGVVTDKVVAWERAIRDQRGRGQQELGVVAHGVVAWESQP